MSSPGSAGSPLDDEWQMSTQPITREQIVSFLRQWEPYRELETENEALVAVALAAEQVVNSKTDSGYFLFNATAVKQLDEALSRLGELSATEQEGNQHA